MKTYTAIYNSKSRAPVVVQFSTFSKELANAAAHRYARDNVLSLDTVKEAA